eukprot:gene15426-21509_t
MVRATERDQPMTDDPALLRFKIFKGFRKNGGPRDCQDEDIRKRDELHKTSLLHERTNFKDSASRQTETKASLKNNFLKISRLKHVSSEMHKLGQQSKHDLRALRSWRLGGKNAPGKATSAEKVGSCLLPKVPHGSCTNEGTLVIDRWMGYPDGNAANFGLTNTSAPPSKTSSVPAAAILTLCRPQAAAAASPSKCGASMFDIPIVVPSEELQLCERSRDIHPRHQQQVGSALTVGQMCKKVMMEMGDYDLLLHETHNHKEQDTFGILPVPMSLALASPCESSIAFPRTASINCSDVISARRIPGSGLGSKAQVTEPPQQHVEILGHSSASRYADRLMPESVLLDVPAIQDLNLSSYKSKNDLDDGCARYSQIMAEYRHGFQVMHRDKAALCPDAKTEVQQDWCCDDPTWETNMAIPSHDSVIDLMVAASIKHDQSMFMKVLQVHFTTRLPKISSAIKEIAADKRKMPYMWLPIPAHSKGPKLSLDNFQDSLLGALGLADNGFSDLAELCKWTAPQPPDHADQYNQDLGLLDSPFETATLRQLIALDMHPGNKADAPLLLPLPQLPQSCSLAGRGAAESGRNGWKEILIMTTATRSIRGFFNLSSLDLYLDWSLIRRSNTMPSYACNGEGTRKLEAGMPVKPSSGAAVPEGDTNHPSSARAHSANSKYLSNPHIGHPILSSNYPRKIVQRARIGVDIAAQEGDPAGITLGQSLMAERHTANSLTGNAVLMDPGDRHDLHIQDIPPPDTSSELDFFLKIPSKNGSLRAGDALRQAPRNGSHHVPSGAAQAPAQTPGINKSQHGNAPNISHDQKDSDQAGEYQPSSDQRGDEDGHQRSHKVLQSKLPEEHIHILAGIHSSHELLQKELQQMDEERLARVDNAVMLSGIWRPQVIERAIEDVEQTQKSGNPAQNMHDKGTVAQILKTAVAIAEHGVQVAHIFCHNICSQLPHLKKALGSTLISLQDAKKKVEDGSVEDNPKQGAMKQILEDMNKKTKSTKVLVVGDSRSFFTLYKLVFAAGYKPAQLKRRGQTQDLSPAAACTAGSNEPHDPNISKSVASPLVGVADGAGAGLEARLEVESYSSQVQHIMRTGCRCIMASEIQAFGTDFPLSSFDAIIRYTSGGTGDNADALATQAAGKEPCANSTRPSVTSEGPCDNSKGQLFQAANPPPSMRVEKALRNFLGDYYSLTVEKPVSFCNDLLQGVPRPGEDTRSRPSGGTQGPPGDPRMHPHEAKGDPDTHRHSGDPHMHSHEGKGDPRIQEHDRYPQIHQEPIGKGGPDLHEHDRDPRINQHDLDMRIHQELAGDPHSHQHTGRGDPDSHEHDRTARPAHPRAGQGDARIHQDHAGDPCIREHGLDSRLRQEHAGKAQRGARGDQQYIPDGDLADHRSNPRSSGVGEDMPTDPRTGAHSSRGLDGLPTHITRAGVRSTGEAGRAVLTRQQLLQGQHAHNPNPGNPCLANPDLGNSNVPNPDFGPRSLDNTNLGNPGTGKRNFGNPDMHNPNSGNSNLADCSLPKPGGGLSYRPVVINSNPLSVVQQRQDLYEALLVVEHLVAATQAPGPRPQTPGLSVSAMSHPMTKTSATLAAAAQTIPTAPSVSAMGHPTTETSAALAAADAVPHPLGLEIVERCMALADIALTPSCCCCIWPVSDAHAKVDESGEVLTVETTKGLMQLVDESGEVLTVETTRRLTQLGMAYSEAFVIVECRTAALAAKLHLQKARLQDTAEASGLSMQLLITGTPLATQQAAILVCSSVLRHFWEGASAKANPRAGSVQPGLIPQQLQQQQARIQTPGLSGPSGPPQPIRNPPLSAPPGPQPLPVPFPVCRAPVGAPVGESETSIEGFFCAMPSVNPLSAAILLAVLRDTGTSLRQLICSPDLYEHPYVVDFLPPQSIQLMRAQLEAINIRVEEEDSLEGGGPAGAMGSLSQLGAQHVDHERGGLDVHAHYMHQAGGMPYVMCAGSQGQGYHRPEGEGQMSVEAQGQGYRGPEGQGYRGAEAQEQGYRRVHEGQGYRGAGALGQGYRGPEGERHSWPEGQGYRGVEAQEQGYRDLEGHGYNGVKERGFSGPEGQGYRGLEGSRGRPQEPGSRDQDAPRYQQQQQQQQQQNADSPRHGMDEHAPGHPGAANPDPRAMGWDRDERASLQHHQYHQQPYQAQQGVKRPRYCRPEYGGEREGYPVPQGHAHLGPQAHRYADPQGHANPGPQAHGYTDPQGHANPGPQAHGYTDPQGHAHPGPQAHGYADQQRRYGYGGPKGQDERGLQGHGYAGRQGYGKRSQEGYGHPAPLGQEGQDGRGPQRRDGYRGPQGQGHPAALEHGYTDPHGHAHPGPQGRYRGPEEQAGRGPQGYGYKGTEGHAPRNVDLEGNGSEEYGYSGPQGHGSRGLGEYGGPRGVERYGRCRGPEGQMYGGVDVYGYRGQGGQDWSSDAGAVAGGGAGAGEGTFGDQWDQLDGPELLDLDGDDDDDADDSDHSRTLNLQHSAAMQQLVPGYDNARMPPPGFESKMPRRGGAAAKAERLQCRESAAALGRHQPAFSRLGGLGGRSAQESGRPRLPGGSGRGRRQKELQQQSQHGDGGGGGGGGAAGRPMDGSEFSYDKELGFLDEFNSCIEDEPPFDQAPSIHTSRPPQSMLSQGTKMSVPAGVGGVLNRLPPQAKGGGGGGSAAAASVGEPGYWLGLSRAATKPSRGKQAGQLNLGNADDFPGRSWGKSKTHAGAPQSTKKKQKLADGWPAGGLSSLQRQPPKAVNMTATAARAPAEARGGPNPHHPDASNTRQQAQDII